MKMKHVLLSFVLALTSYLVQAQTQATPKTDQPTLAEYVGNYKMSSYIAQVVVSQRDGNLYGAADDNGEYKLVKKEGADLFQSTSSYGTMFQFKRDPITGKVNGLVLTLMGQEVTGKKADE
jgi:hypothetical protein